MDVSRLDVRRALSAARHSVPVRRVKEALKGPLQRRRLASQRGTFAVDLHGRRGLGGALALAIPLIAHGERTGVVARVRCFNDLYARGTHTDIFGLYFQPVQSSVEPVGRPASFTNEESLRFLPLRRTVPLWDAHEILLRHFQPVAWIQDTIDDLIRRYPAIDLAVHFRGTDKIREAKTADFAAMSEAVFEALAGRTRATVFLATDEPAFRDFLEGRFPDVEFAGFDAEADVREGEPRHFSSMAPAAKAQEAIVNMALLARAPLLVRTSSYLSAMSKLIRPELETRTINAMRGGHLPFPEDIIALEERGPGTSTGTHRRTDP